ALVSQGVRLPTLGSNAARGGDFAPTDAGLAERFLTAHGQDLRYCELLGGWFVWDGKHWCRDEAGLVWCWALNTVRALYAEASNEPDNDRRAKLARFALGYENHSRLQAVVTLAARLGSKFGIVARPADFDADPWLLNTPSGIVDLRTGELHPHDSDALCSKITAAPYVSPARSGLWDAFL